MSSKAESTAQVSFKGETYVSTTENTATILHRNQNEVFYNPVQETNRDFSVAMIKTFQKLREADQKTPGGRNISILEALSATGLRTIRYWKEIDSVGKIVANDIDGAAVEAIRRNFEYNDLPGEVEVSHADATALMYQHRDEANKFDVVDLDPYGSAATFLDSAVQCVRNGGLLCVTCTDLSVLCGNNVEVCYSKYGALALKGKHCHEMAIRIVLAAIDSHAARYQKYVRPLVSLQIDFYLRVFVRVFHSPLEVKKSSAKKSLVFKCSGCKSLAFQPLGSVQTQNKSVKCSPPLFRFTSTCDQCGKLYHMGGPIWTDPIYDKAVLEAVKTELKTNSSKYGTHQRLYGMLLALSEEIHEPLFHNLAEMCHTLHVSTPPLATIKSILTNAGYSFSTSHTDPHAVKTNAPVSVVWDILRCWSAKHPSKTLSKTSPGYAIVSKPPTFEADFSQPFKKKEKKKEARYLPNPRAYWGPGSRATGKRLAGASENSSTTPQKKPKSVDSSSSS